MYAFRIQRMSDSDAPRLSLIAGIAMFTIVVSSWIMKNPRQRTVRTTQGLCLRSVAGAVLAEAVIGRAPHRCHRWRPGGDTSVHSRSTDRSLASRVGVTCRAAERGQEPGCRKV